MSPLTGVGGGLAGLAGGGPFAGEGVGGTELAGGGAGGGGEGAGFAGEALGGISHPWQREGAQDGAGGSGTPPRLHPPTSDADVPHQHWLGHLRPDGERGGSPVQHVVAAAQFHLQKGWGVPRGAERGGDPTAGEGVSPVCGESRD